MKAKISRSVFLAALKMLQMYVTPENRMPWIHVLTVDDSGEQNIVLGATDTLSYTEVNIAADVTESGEFLIGDKIDRVLSNLRSDTVSLSMKPDSNTLMVGEDSGSKIRLQTLKGIPIQRDAIRERLDKVDYSIDVVFDKAEFSRLVKLSELFPTSGEKQTWVVLNIGKGMVVGETQVTEEGGVNNYPLSLISLTGKDSGDDSATLVISTSFFKNPLQFCKDSIFIRASQDRRDPIIIGDPDNPIWFTTVSQMIRSGEDV